MRAAVLALICLALLPATAAAGRGPTFTPGAPGIGDPYFPLDGNGGYDVSDYDLDFSYDPDSDRLNGTATIRARATQNLSRFNLDLVGMNVRRISIDGRSATWRREGDELVVRPRAGLRKFRRFKVVIGYYGVPETIGDPTLGDLAGFVHTDDGTLVVGQPDAAATWYPVNDHPLDKAAYTFHITVPAGLEAVANGVLTDKRTRRGETTWTWTRASRWPRT